MFDFDKDKHVIGGTGSLVDILRCGFIITGYFQSSPIKTYNIP